jgi:hypothetical protein
MPYDFSTPEIPEGMERTFPFFLVSRQLVECLAFKVEPCTVESSPSFPRSEFKGGIPIKELLNGRVSSDLNQIGECGFVARSSLHFSTINTAAVIKKSVTKSPVSRLQNDFLTLSVHDEWGNETLVPKLVGGEQAFSSHKLASLS